MNESWRSYKEKNWQWRVIISASLFLLLAKPIGTFAYRMLGLDKMYANSANMMQRVGLSDAITPPASQTELVLDVKNDTPNNYTIETKISSGQIELTGKTVLVSNVKRITVKPYSKIANPIGKGDIIFLSEPIADNNRTCQEVHTLTYDLKNANKVQQPVAINLSTISSRMECKNNGVSPSDDESNQ